MPAPRKPQIGDRVKHRGREVELVDVPTFGKSEAPIGTVEWAEYVRLQMCGKVDDLANWAKDFRGYVEVVHQKRAWTLLRDHLGKPFPTWDAFCQERQPWGLGRGWAELRPALEAALLEAGETPTVVARTLQLVTAPPAKDAPPPPAHVGPGRGNAGGTQRPQRLDAPGARGEKAVRAIAERTPEPARELYRRDLLGQKEAAKLGPKSPTPAEAERVTAIAITLAETAKAAPKPTTEAERRALKRTITVKARELLGEEPEDRVAKLARTFAALSPEGRARVVGETQAPSVTHERVTPVACTVCGNAEERAARAADIENVIERVMGEQPDGAARAIVRDRVLRFLAESVNYEGGDRC